MKRLVIVDIDGTVSKVGDRLKYLQQVPKDWDQFYAHCDEDECIPNILDLIDNLAESYDIVFCTGRREAVKDITRTWINEHTRKLYVENVDLLMRKNGDHRHDTEVKPELLNEFLNSYGYLPESVAFILEDRTSMVNKWRELGYTCLQVAEGNF